MISFLVAVALKALLILASCRFLVPALLDIQAALTRDPNDLMMKRASRWLRKDWHLPQQRALLIVMSLLDLIVFTVIAISVFTRIQL